MKGWLAIAAFVIAYDFWAGMSRNPTLSTIFRYPARRHPLVSCVCCAYMMAHLHGLIPGRYDPLGHLDFWAIDRRLGGIRTHNPLA